MSVIQIECAYCGNLVFKQAGGINRSRRIGAPVFCDRLCFGLARRSNKTGEQRRAEKAAYDARRRASLAEEIKAAKRAYHKRTYDPAKAAIVRKGRMTYHVEYCRRSEYRAYKKTYDRQYRAKKYYGDFAECFLLVMDIRDECLRQQSDYEIRMAKGTFGKSQQRKRAHERSLRKEPKVGPVGNLELRQGGKNGSLTGGLRGVPGPRNPSDYEHATARRSASEAAGRSGCYHLCGNVADTRQESAQ